MSNIGPPRPTARFNNMDEQAFGHGDIMAEQQGGFELRNPEPFDKFNTLHDTASNEEHQEAFINSIG
jgi:hypothetical protein